MSCVAKGKYAEWLTPDGLLLLEGWARDGLTDEQIAKNAGISNRTFYEWQIKHPQISQALKRGKAPVDLQVENALLKRALGFKYTETRTEKIGKHTTKTIITEKVVLPDTTAQIFWLKNRRPDKWRDRHDENITISDFDSELVDEVEAMFNNAAQQNVTGRSN